MKKTVAGLLMAGVLAAAGCGNSQQGDNGQSEGNQVSNTTVNNTTTNVTNVTNVVAAGDLSLVKLRPAANLGGTGYHLEATFDGDINDLDKRLDGASLKMVYNGDQYVTASAELYGNGVQLFQVIDNLDIFSSSSIVFFDILNYYQSYYNYYFAIMGGFNLNDKELLLIDAYTSMAIMGGGYDFSNYIIDGTYVTDAFISIPGVLRKGATYDFILNGNFSCGDLSFLDGSYAEIVLNSNKIISNFWSSDLNDACLAKVKSQLQGWLDEALGADVAYVSGISSVLLNANNSTAVSITMNRSYVLSEEDSVKLADVVSPTSHFLLNQLDLMAEDGYTFAAKRLVLPANLIKDGAGRPNAEQTFYLAEGSFFNEMYGIISSREYKEPKLTFSLNEDDDGILAKGASIEIELENGFLNSESAALTVAELLRNAGMELEVVSTEETRIIFTAKKDITLPIQVKIPDGLLYDRNGQKVPAQTLLITDITAPHILADDNGNTLFSTLAATSSYSGRGKSLLSGDIFSLNFSEEIDTKLLMDNYPLAKEFRTALNIPESDAACIDVAASTNTVSILIKCTIDLSEIDTITLPAISADYVVDTVNGTQAATKIKMAADVVPSIKVADIFAPQPIEFSYNSVKMASQDKLQAGDSFSWYRKSLYKADGTEAGELDIINTITAIEGATIKGGTIETLKQNMSYSNGAYILNIPDSGLEIEMAENVFYSQAKIILGEGLYNERGISVEGSYLPINFNALSQNLLAIDYNMTAYYMKGNDENSCGSLTRNSSILLEIPGEMSILGSSDDYMEIIESIATTLKETLSENSSTPLSDNFAVQFNEIISIPDGRNFAKFNVIFAERPINADSDYAVTLNEDLLVTHKIGRTMNVNISLPATTARIDIKTISGDLQDGRLLPGDFVRITMNCNDDSLLGKIQAAMVADGSFMLQNGVDLLYQLGKTRVFEYLGQPKDISSGLDFTVAGLEAPLTLKEQKPVSVLFQYVKGSADGNQAVFQTSEAIDGVYILDQAYGIDHAADDISFIEGGQAKSNSLPLDDPYLYYLWCGILSAC